MDYNYNPYEILGIAENATPQEIEEKYLQLREKYQKTDSCPARRERKPRKNCSR